MYSNNILNFQESMTILNACKKQSGNLLKTPCVYVYIYIYIYIYIVLFGPVKPELGVKTHNRMEINL